MKYLKCHGLHSSRKHIIHRLMQSLSRTLLAVGSSACYLPLEVHGWGRSYYGGPHHVCTHCGANFWYQEHRKHLGIEKQVVYTRHCRGGKVSLPIYPNWPSPLAKLLWFDGGLECNCFMCLIRQYNSMFTFTSIGVHGQERQCWTWSMFLKYTLFLSLPSFTFMIRRMILVVEWVYSLQWIHLSAIFFI